MQDGEDREEADVMAKVDKAVKVDKLADGVVEEEAEEDVTGGAEEVEEEAEEDVIGGAEEVEAGMEPGDQIGTGETEIEEEQEEAGMEAEDRTGTGTETEIEEE